MTDQTPEADTSPLLQAIDRVRETAKWIIAAFAVVGALLAGESVLANLGELQFLEGRLMVAAVAAGVGLGAVATAIWFTANVLLPAQAALPDLVKEGPGTDLARLVNNSPELLRGYATTLDEFGRIYTAATTDLVSKARAASADPGNNEKQVEYEAAQNKLMAMAPVVTTIVNLGLYEKVRRSFLRTRWIILGCAMIAGAALVVFGWAANPADTEAETPKKAALSLTRTVPVDPSSKATRAL